MKKAVHFGPGKIGRGFFGQIYYESGYIITFIGVNQNKVDMINEEKEYKIYLINRDQIEGRTYDEMYVKNIKGINILEQSKIESEIFKADIVSTSVGVNNLANISKVIASGLIHRWKNGNLNELNILLGENKVDTDKYFRRLLVKEIKKTGYLEVFNSTIGIVDTSIERLVPEIENDKKLNSELDIIVGADYIFPVDKNGFIGKIPQIKNIKLIDNFEFYKRRKIFVFNSLHSNMAYLGHLRGYSNIHEAANDDLISNIVYNAALESANALSKEYGVNIEDTLERINKMILRLKSEELNDTIARVAKEPIRKLSKDERIIGGANLCVKNNILPFNLILCAAAAMHYYNENDKESIYLRDILKKKGIEIVLSDVCEIDSNSIMYDLIRDFYHLVLRIAKK